MITAFGKCVTMGVLTALALAGCSKPGEHVPDYHTLIPTAEAGPIQEALAQAKMKCNEANSSAEAEVSAWCGAVEKAKRCRSSGKTHMKGNYPALTVWVSEDWLREVTAHPTVACPPR